ncbi:hypothetical protein WN943_014930 [Citrus x changshan-huyou]
MARSLKNKFHAAFSNKLLLEENPEPEELKVFAERREAPPNDTLAHILQQLEKQIRKISN